MPTTKPHSPNATHPPRLPFLDGIRGLAALYVTLHHAALMIPPAGLSGPVLAIRFFLRHGHGAVAVFIVLSGYCLMLPVACDPLSRAPFKWGAFFKRRARRILPAYFGALFFCWILVALIPDFGHSQRSPWDRALPVASPGVIASHVLLVHNLSERWIFKIDPPMWSVATEWQIYLLFPLLVGLWRRTGIVTTIASGFAIGFAVAALAIPLKNSALRELCPWFAGLFTLGMAAALAAHASPLIRERGGTRRFVLAVSPIVVALLCAGVAFAGTDDRDFMITDPIIGVLMAGLLVRWTRRAVSGGAGPRLPLLRLLECRAAITLGTISYSLYLIHYPLLALGDAVLRRGSFSPDARLLVLVLVASPAILLASFLFHRVFERPFTSSWRQPTGASPATHRYSQISRDSQTEELMLTWPPPR
ncbi:Peptidoglycan/LPS O-acetylase OafA/YrhL, contains acyltransferase and SGNH-hydrolase domains [Singulisphaera sp. GP187]|uniref:acyltransferase family protein n=1 Tax=Singulisphaera sp. GP187 TaxID=1882752 RepID=UPI0009276AF6|nr:acyltransferase [Singulisphaera sp. GP187]SIO61783.1 Peptidoglycan/LPS O-acetylase OafA/YrhL, contains acyltransferase and SGNH-hydrolase domains [Singulisphaera sp. GP187]